MAKKKQLDFSRHSSHLEWNAAGKCTYRQLRFRKCKGPRWANKCEGYWKDDYGMNCWCSKCGGSGTETWVEFIRVPKFDAPKVPKTWRPEWEA